MSQREVSIPMSDGDARAFAFTPEAGAGPWPGVLMFMDANGMRPAMYEMAERLAQNGYFVLLPDFYWRAAPYEPLDVMKMRGGDPALEAELARLRASTNHTKNLSDAGACIAWLEEQPQVSGGGFGVTGYCMGGRLALRVAGSFPDKIAAAASFHGGGLANDEPISPHLLADSITAKVLVAGADEDKNFPVEQFERLTKAFAAANVDADVSIWPGAKHGWVPRDTPVHSPEAAERHWRELTGFLDGVLK